MLLCYSFTTTLKKCKFSQYFYHFVKTVSVLKESYRYLYIVSGKVSRE